MKNASAKMEKFKKAGKLVATGIVTALLAIGVGAVKAAGDMEMLTTQFEVMLGSAEAANAMMDKLKTFAATTPFALKDLAQGSQTLLSFGVAQEDVIQRMRMLGDASGGSSEKLKGLILAFGKVQTKGKASMEEINMIAERGVPIIGTLTKNLGVTEQEFFKLVSAGKIGRKEITDAFQTMTSEGGIFFEGMEKQSLTLGGLISTMKDNFSLLLAEIGEGLLPAVKEFVGVMTELAQGPLKELGKGLTKVLVPVFKAIAKLMPTIIKFLVPILEMAGELVGVVLNEALVPIAEELLPVILELVQELMPITILIIRMLVKLIPPVVRILKTVIQIITGLVRFLLPAVKGILSVLDRTVIKFLKNVLRFIGDIFEAIKEMPNTFKRIFENIINLFKDMWNAFAKITNKGIEVFNQISPGTKFDIAGRVPLIHEAMLQKAQAEQKSTTIQMSQENNINAPVGAAPGQTGMTPAALGKAAQSTFKSMFSVEMQKLILASI